MKLSWRRHDRQSARAFALGILLLGGAAACETVATPEIDPAQNVVDGGSISGQVLSLDGRPVPSALLRAGNLQAVTDAEGFFRISGLAATSRLAVNVEAPGYDGTTAIYEVRTGADLSRPIRVQPLAAPVTIQAGQGGAVPIAGGGQVIIPSNAFAGVPATDPVTVRATYIDTNDAAQFSTAPGDFTARTFSGQSVQIESFGMLNVDVRNAQGQRVDLAPGQQATIQFPLRGGTGAATRPLWTFDTQQGIWVEEGSVTVTQSSQDVNVNTLAPRRNVDVPFRPVCISVRTLRADKITPRPNQFVTATGISYAGATQGWTNPQGVVQLQVRAASQVLIQSGPAQQPVTTPPAGTTGCPLVATLAF